MVTIDNYPSALDYLLSMLPMYQRVGKAAYKADLKNTLLLDEFYQHPHTAYKTIHVAGTNGKGSVSHMLAAVLQSAGYKTGLYTSPHYLDFRERIKVNGKCIQKNFVVDFVNRSAEIIESVKPSFFELTVLMSMDYFRSQKVDVAVFEVGMGGRLDSTNVISPVLSIITNIGHDHQQFLGNSLAEIAGEKAGIIKNGVPVVVGESQPETMDIFNKVAQEKSTSIVFADKLYVPQYSLLDAKMNQQVVFSSSRNKEQTINTDMFGGYQKKNLATALAAIDLLKYSLDIPDDAQSKGLLNIRGLTGMIGRFELLGTNPRFYCDAAHNEEGFREMLKQVEQIPYKQFHLMLGFVRDKNIQSLLRMIPEGTRCYYTQADIPRALPANELKMKGDEEGINGKAFSKPKDAYNEITALAAADDLIMVSGSIFLVAEIIKIKKNIKSLCEKG